MHRFTAAGRKKLRAGMILLSCVVSISSFSVGQQQTESLSDTSLDELVKVKVYSASKHLQDQSDAPAYVTVVTADEIRKHGYRTLADILQSVGGFYVSYDRGYSYIGVRGFSRPGDYNSRTLLMIDGHRLNDSLYDMAMVGTEMPMDVDLIERVEVIRGPGSSLYGTSAFFAVVNVVTRKTREYRGLEVTGSGNGSLGDASLRITEGGEFKGVDVLLSGTVYSNSGESLFYPEFNSPANNNGITRGTDYDRSQNVFGNLSYRNWTLEALYGRREKGDPTAAWGTVFGDSRNRTLDTRGFLELGYTTRVKGWDLDARVSYDRYIYDGYYDFASQDHQAVLNRDIDDASWWGTEAEISRLIQRRHKVTAGFEFRDNYRESLLNFDVQPFTCYSNVNHDAIVFAGFIQDEFTISKHVALNVGFRRDHYSTFGESNNPRIALILHPFAPTTLKLVYGTAFRAPNVSEQYNSIVNTVLDRGLRPESIRTMQAILEQAVGSRTHVVLAGYQNRISNLISYTPPDAQGFVFRNIAAVRTFGIETAVDHNLENGMQARVSYAYSQIDDPQDSAAVVNSPHHVIKAALSIPLYRQVLFSSVDASYVGRRETLSETTVGGEARVNLTLYAHEFHNGLSFSASAYNLLDKKYYDPGYQWHIQDAIQQDGRNLRVRVRYNLRRPR